ncbi:MAG: hypothetical protein GX879_06035 [Bacteroidales bacterium]|nr:hypothetical protein [Bacteroidales bacterium]
MGEGKITKVMVYKTSDGQLFRSKILAEEYQRNINNIDRVMKEIKEEIKDE